MCHPDNQSLKFAKYSLRFGSLNTLDKALDHNTTKILSQFKLAIPNRIVYDDNGHLSAIPILVWHNVSPLNKVSPGWVSNTTTPETFEAQMKFLNLGIRTLSINDLKYIIATSDCLYALIFS